MQAKNFRPIKAIKPTDGLSEFIGKTLIITMDQPPGGTPVVVEKIQGSMVKEFETCFEVNNAFHIVVLDAYKQLNNDKSITQEQIDQFRESVGHVEERINPKNADSIALDAKPVQRPEKIRAVMHFNPLTASLIKPEDLGTAKDPDGKEIPIEIEVSAFPKDGKGHFFFGPHFMGDFDFTYLIKDKGLSHEHDEDPGPKAS